MEPHEGTGGTRAYSEKEERKGKGAASGSATKRHSILVRTQRI